MLDVMKDVGMLVSVLLMLVDCEGRSLLGRSSSLSDCVGVWLLPDVLRDAGVPSLIEEDLDRVKDNVSRVLLLTAEVRDKGLSLDETREDWSFTGTDDDWSSISDSVGYVPLLDADDNKVLPEEL